MRTEAGAFGNRRFEIPAVAKVLKLNYHLWMDDRRRLPMPGSTPANTVKFTIPHTGNKMTRISSYLTQIIVAGLLLAVAASAGQFSSSFTAPLDQLSVTRENGIDIVRLPGWAVSSAPGLPELPCTEIHVALPPGAVYSGLSVTGVDSYPLSGRYQVRPSPRPRPMGVDEETPFRFFDPPPGILSESITATTDRTSRAPLLEKISTWDLAGQNFASFRLNPVRFDRSTGSITLVETVRFTINWTQPRSAAASPCNFTERGRKLYESMLAGMVINPGDVSIPCYTEHETGGPLPGGLFEHIVITPQQLSDSWDPLVTWHNVKGVRDTVITTEWIESTFGGSGTDDKIRNFIRYVHGNWGVVWVLLGGDVSLIPHHVAEILGRDIATDTYYADFDDDYKNEVFLGRASVKNKHDVDDFVSRVLTYEKNPPKGFGATALLMGFDIDNSTEAEEMMIDFKEDLFPWYFGVAQVYDSHGGDHREEALSWLEVGPNLVNHADLAGTASLGTGKFNHGLELSKNDISSLANGAALGNFYSAGSFSCAYQVDDCIGEEYISARNGGGLTYIGNSDLGWYTPGSTETYSFLYDRKFMESVFTGGFSGIGQVFADSKNSYYPSDPLYCLLWAGLNLLGEPELPLWLNDPGEALAGYMPTLRCGRQDIAVRVFRDWIGVGNALVCVRKPDDGIYQAGLTDTSGSRVFTIDATEGDLFVTISGHDLLPVEETIQIVDTSILKKGPYSFFQGNNTTMAVAWQLDETRMCAIRWGRDISCSDGWAQTVEQNPDHLHGRLIAGLTPGAFYFYTISAGGPEEYQGTFRAAPHNSGQTARIFFYGDTRSHPEMHNLVCSRMAGDYENSLLIPTIALHTGDWTSDDSTNAWDNEYFHRDAAGTRKLLANIPMNGCRGNHDGAGSNYNLFWPYPYVDDFYWSFDYGPLHVAVVDQYVAYYPGSPQHIWLSNDLSNTEKPWKIVVFHEPAWAAGGGHENNEEAQEYIHPLCLANDVPVAIAGHNHYYSRCTVDGIEHVTTAGGGAPLYGCDPGSPHLVAWAKAYHYVSLLAEGNTLEVKAIDIFGTVLDSFSVEKN